jgi:hypothetical protein
MYIRFLFIISLLLFVFSTVHAQDTWELRRNEQGITIYSRRLGKLVELRLLCEFDASPEQLTNQLLNIPNYTNWVYGNRRSDIIKRINDHDIIYFTESHLPWPIQDRDLVIELNIMPATQSSPLIIQAKSIEGILPPKPHFIRVPYSLATWRISPLPGNKTKLDYTFSLDPGGSIPAWIVNWTIATGPYRSFLKLQDIMKAENKK